MRVSPQFVIGLAVSTTAAVVSLSILPGAATTQALSAGPSQAPSPAGLKDPTIPVLPPPTCASGQTPVRASGAGKTADGAFLYDFTIAGKLNRVVVPPSSFSPLTATDAQLSEYGFPPRPADPTAAASWTEQFRGFKGVPLPSLCLTDHANTPNQNKNPTPVTGIPAATAKATATNGTSDLATSGNWGGQVLYDGAQYVAVQGDWIQSFAADCGCGTSDTDESSWTGLGGYADSGLLQEGTDMQGTPSNIFPWYEYLHDCNTPGCNPTEIAIGGLTVTGGMSIHTYSAYQTSNGQANFLVCAGGYCQSIIAYLDGSYYYGNTAEWIDERPSFCTSGCYKPITNFQYDDWTGSAQRSNGAWVGLNEFPGYQVSLVNSSGQTLIAPAAFGVSTYRDTWFQAS